jgi:hypothetical protein
VACPRISSIHLLRISGQWTENVHSDCSTKKKDKQRRGQSLFLSVARG